MHECGPQFGGNFMWGCEKSGACSARSDGVDGERAQRRFTPSPKLREEFREALGALRIAQVKGGRGDIGVAQENSRQLQSCVAGDTYDGDLTGVSHFTRASIFFWRDSRVFLFGVMIKTVSSPAMVPAISGNCEPSTAAARG